MHKIEVLVIDDSEEDRELASYTLRKHKFIDDVLCFRDGTEALSFLLSQNNYKPRFIFLDLNMPKMGGLEFIHVLKSDARTKDIPVAILTATTELLDIKEGLKLGVKYYIQKPIEAEDVEKIASELGFNSENLD